VVDPYIIHRMCSLVIVEDPLACDGMPSMRRIMPAAAHAMMLNRGEELVISGSARLLGIGMKHLAEVDDGGNIHMCIDLTPRILIALQCDNHPISKTPIAVGDGGLAPRWALQTMILVNILALTIISHQVNKIDRRITLFYTKFGGIAMLPGDALILTS